MQIDLDAARGMQETIGRQRRRGPWVRLLDSTITLAGRHAQLLRHAERPWASATFCGSRHTAALLFDGAEAIVAAEHFIEALPEHEFDISGVLVADAAVTEVRMTMLPVPQCEIEVEFLLLDEV
ncbi:hypothetical protein [Novosphingobium sp. TH158]|uniref:hypothetical protein n=1 Tax=Novosphingobium sp. TH158 TaxID=2067455 RepID=UPI000C7AD8E3|nr:hypothetical protein [Novosphingobium sp. TH158]PLK25610.1 hypothetical protein C0V78_00905 [Novosphingobium sp. TH158]